MKVRAKKHLGQHFLKDEAIAKKIAGILTEKNYDVIVEIGPGMGVLTKFLLQKKSPVNAVEIDPESVTYLQEVFPGEQIHLNTSKEKLTIIKGDFLKQNVTALFQKKQLAIIGNFPYNISSQILFKAIENRTYIAEFCGMFQKEVAKRIVEKEGSRTYGILSVLTQAFYDAEYIFTVSPSVFDPPPKVDSGVIRLIRKKDFSLPVNEQLFFRVVKTAFNQRRKMLRRSLKSFNLSETLREDLIFAKRPEHLSVNEFISLTRKIASHGV
ncbi:MAG: 16S rRNA (adenine(1518)-N(6)/adenine(1519)-N(6))-dimethyltransferase RsmA [Flavobacteriaceae bacterium]|nr:MAG: 16S rRNA (adenine(1518)-N(6)/adenine(1519)-N(6))-dimethyltransferase RsmA [Flavobacteriaceae bacterium]